MSDSRTLLTCLRVSSSPTASAMAWIRPLLLIALASAFLAAAVFLVAICASSPARAAPRRARVAEPYTVLAAGKSEFASPRPTRVTATREHAAHDVAEKEAGGWLLVELNDGGSAGIPEGGIADAFT